MQKSQKLLPHPLAASRSGHTGAAQFTPRAAGVAGRTAPARRGRWANLAKGGWVDGGARGGEKIGEHMIIIDCIYIYTDVHI